MLAGVDDGENTDYDNLRRLEALVRARLPLAVMDDLTRRAVALGVEVDWHPIQSQRPDPTFVRLMLEEIEAMPAEQQASAARAVNDGSSPTDWAKYTETRSATIVITYPVDTPELAHVAETETKVNLHQDALEHLVEEMQENWPGSTVALHFTDLTAGGQS